MSAESARRSEPEQQTSSTAQSFDGPWTVWYQPRRWHLRERMARWYMGRIAGRYCPCEWPYKSRWLIRFCGRIDDAYCNAQFRDFAHFALARHQRGQVMRRTR